MGTYTVKQGYQSLQNIATGPQQRIWANIWNSDSILEINAFFWLLVKNKHLRADNLRKRGFHGTSRCNLCQEQKESSQHLFLECPFTIWVSKIFLGTIGHNFVLQGNIPTMATRWKGCYTGKIGKNKTLCRIWNIVLKRVC